MLVSSQQHCYCPFMKIYLHLGLLSKWVASLLGYSSVWWWLLLLLAAALATMSYRDLSKQRKVVCDTFFTKMWTTDWGFALGPAQPLAGVRELRSLKNSSLSITLCTQLREHLAVKQHGWLFFGLYQLLGYYLRTLNWVLFRAKCFWSMLMLDIIQMDILVCVRKLSRRIQKIQTDRGLQILDFVTSNIYAYIQTFKKLSISFPFFKLIV